MFLTRCFVLCFWSVRGDIGFGNMAGELSALWENEG